MKYQVVLPKRVKKRLEKIDSRYQPKIKYALVKLADNPLLGKSLEGKLKAQRSFYVWPYRIIYEVYKNKLIILVLSIKHRQGVYK